MAALWCPVSFEPNSPLNLHVRNGYVASKYPRVDGFSHAIGDDRNGDRGPSKAVSRATGRLGRGQFGVLELGTRNSS